MPSGEFKKLISITLSLLRLPKSQYYLGLTKKFRITYNEAYQAFQKVIDKYPFSEL